MLHTIRAGKFSSSPVASFEVIRDTVGFLILLTPLPPLLFFDEISLLFSSQIFRGFFGRLILRGFFIL